MNQFTRIVKVLQVEPFKIRTLWTNGEERLHDFSEKLSLFSHYDRWRPLTDPEQFVQVAVGEGDTLYWPNIRVIDSQGQEQPIALDPDVLYAESQLLEPSPVIEIDTRKEVTQAEYARRFKLSPSKVRTLVSRGKLKTRYVPQIGKVLVIVEDNSGTRTFHAAGEGQMIDSK